MVVANGSLEMGGRTWTAQQASPDRLVLSVTRMEDEDAKFSAAKARVQEEISQRRQDIQHFEEDKASLFERMEDEAEDADQLATELGKHMRHNHPRARSIIFVHFSISLSS